MTIVDQMVTGCPPEAPPVLDPHLLDVAEFLRTECPRVVATVRMTAGDRDGAADAVHEALVQLLTSGQRDWPRNVAAWITVVASNRARDSR